MLHSPYANVFFYFRGPSGAGGVEPTSSRQVEDNTTNAFEAKVGTALDGGQLAKHAADWGVPQPGKPGPDGLPVAWVFTTWSDAYRWARSLSGQDHLTPVARFLLTQFAEYLEIIGVTPFAGFRPEDFDLLAARRDAVADGSWTDGGEPAGDPAQAALVKERVRKLWDAILPRLSGAERAALGEIHLGSLRAQDYRMWAATNWDEPGVNFTFELDPDQLELDLVAWKRDQVDLFDRWLEQGSAVARLSSLSGWELVVWRRRAFASTSGKPYWMHNTYEVLERIPLPPPTDLRERLAAHRGACEAGWELTAYHLRRSWNRDAVLAAGEDLADDAVEALRTTIPLLHPINRHSRSRYPRHG